MPRTLPLGFLVEKNQLSSTHPLIFLAELDYGAGVERVTNNPEPITFQGLLFAGDVPIQIPEFREQGLSETPRMQILVGNATRVVSSLAENHWVGLLNPIWTVTLWYIDATDPDLIPLSGNVGTYDVLNIETPDLFAVFDLYESTISNNRTLPLAKVTVNSGFPRARNRTL